jgi:hypothetical protein
MDGQVEEGMDGVNEGMDGWVGEWMERSTEGWLVEELVEGPGGRKDDVRVNG